jgi:hypothetical protein
MGKMACGSGRECGAPGIAPSSQSGAGAKGVSKVLSTTLMILVSLCFFAPSTTDKIFGLRRP